MWNTKRVSEFYFFIYKHLISLAILSESAVLLLAVPCHFVKNQKFICAWFFNSHAILFVYIIPHYLSYYTSRVFTLFFHHVLAFYIFHANFKISLSCAKNKVMSELWLEIARNLNKISTWIALSSNLWSYHSSPFI